MKRAKKLLGILLMMVAVMALSLNVHAAVKINKSKVTLIKGQTVSLKVNGTSVKAKWKSSKPAVASVTTKGVVKAKKKGTAVITATIKSKAYKCRVTVETPKISKTSAHISVGDELTLKISGTKQKVKWSSGDTGIAAVSSGVVTAKAAGETTITAKISKKKYTCKVTVEEKETEPDNEGTVGDITADTGASAAANSGSGASGMVWIPRTGTKYHATSTCSGMRNPSYVSLSEAISRGYTPCSKCY